MNTAIVNVRVETALKKQAQKVASELGISLSAIIHGFLKQLVKTKTVTFSSLDEYPNEATRKILRQAEINWKKGNHSPAFKTGEEAVAWLEKQGI